VFGFRQDDFYRVGGRTEDTAHFRDLLQGIQDVDGIEPRCQEEEKRVSRAKRQRVLSGQFEHRLVVAAPAYQGFPRGFTESQAKSDPGDGVNHGFVDVFDRLDKVALAQDKVHVVRFLDP